MPRSRSPANASKSAPARARERSGSACGRGSSRPTQRMANISAAPNGDSRSSRSSPPPRSAGERSPAAQQMLALVRHLVRMARLLGALGVLLFGAAVVASALAVRESTLTTTTAADGAAGSGTAAAPRIAPMAPLRFGPGYAPQSAQISPDGKYATAMTTDWSAEGFFALSDDASSGFVIAREIARLEKGQGQVWLSSPTALLIAVSEPTKRSLLTVTGADGKTIELGSAEYTTPAAPSPDGRWIAVAESLSQPSQIRIFDRTGAAPPRVIARGVPSIVGRLQWDATGRVLDPNTQTVVAVDLSGH